MSQHVIETDELRWVFGWDQTLMTFFLQKHEKELNDSDPDRNPVIWLGADRHTKMYEVEELVTNARQLGLKLPYKALVALFEDKDEGR